MPEITNNGHLDNSYLVGEDGLIHGVIGKRIGSGLASEIYPILDTDFVLKISNDGISSSLCSKITGIPIDTINGFPDYFEISFDQIRLDLDRQEQEVSNFYHAPTAYRTIREGITLHIINTMYNGHPNIIKQHGGLKFLRKKDRNGSVLYYPMLQLDYIRDSHELKMLKNEKNNIANSIELLEDIGLALDWIHSRNEAIIHRDLHSNNIIFSNRLRKLILIDFGYSKTGDVTHIGQRLGSLNIQAPEIIEDSRYASIVSDNHNLGVLVSEILGGTEVNFRRLNSSNFPIKDADIFKSNPTLVHNAGEIIADRLQLTEDQGIDIKKVLDLATDKNPDKRLVSAALIINLVNRVIGDPQSREFNSASRLIDHLQDNNTLIEFNNYLKRNLHKISTKDDVNRVIDTFGRR